MSELILRLAPGPEDESPYEALCEATSCHSLDSLTSGKSSDRDSGRLESEAGKVSLQKCSLTHEFPLGGGSGPLAIAMYHSLSHDHLQKDRALHPIHAGPGHEEEVSSKMTEEMQSPLHPHSLSVLSLPLLQTCYSNNSVEERRELVEEEEDHTYELLLTAQTKIPASIPESQSRKCKCV